VHPSFHSEAGAITGRAYRLKINSRNRMSEAIEKKISTAMRRMLSRIVDFRLHITATENAEENQEIKLCLFKI